MSKNELACKLQGSAVGFVEVTRDLGFWKIASLSDKTMLKIQIMHAFKVCVFPLYPPRSVLFLS
jgi:hypothetical protein